MYGNREALIKRRKELGLTQKAVVNFNMSNLIKISKSNFDN